MFGQDFDVDRYRVADVNDVGARASRPHRDVCTVGAENARSSIKRGNKEATRVP
jgi:hypothetical protein